MQKLVGAFHLSRRVSDENRACSISIRFFKIMDPFDGRSFLMCSHDPFFGTNKNRILKNGSCERAFTHYSGGMHLVKVPKTRCNLRFKLALVSKHFCNRLQNVEPSSTASVKVMVFDFGD